MYKIVGIGRPIRVSFVVILFLDVVFEIIVSSTLQLTSTFIILERSQWKHIEIL